MADTLETQSAAATELQHRSMDSGKAQSPPIDTAAAGGVKNATDSKEAQESSPTSTEQRSVTEAHGGAPKDLEAQGEKQAAQHDEPTEPTDPNVVGFDGPDDTENPVNWSSGKKWGIISILAFITFITYAH